MENIKPNLEESVQEQRSASSIYQEVSAIKSEVDGLNKEFGFPLKETDSSIDLFEKRKQIDSLIAQNNALLEQLIPEAEQYRQDWQKGTEIKEDEMSSTSSTFYNAVKAIEILQKSNIVTNDEEKDLLVKIKDGKDTLSACAQAIRNKSALEGLEEDLRELEAKK